MLFTAMGNWNLSDHNHYPLFYYHPLTLRGWVSETQKIHFGWSIPFKVRMMFQCSVFPCFFAKMFDLGVICPPSIVLVASMCCCSDRQLCIFWQALIFSMNVTSVFSFLIKRLLSSELDIIFLDFTVASLIFILYSAVSVISGTSAPFFHVSDCWMMGTQVLLDAEKNTTTFLKMFECIK